MGSLQLLNAIKTKVDLAKNTKKGHMFIEVKVRGFNTRALVDTGASHNCIKVKEAKNCTSKWIMWPLNYCSSKRK